MDHPFSVWVSKFFMWGNVLDIVYGVVLYRSELHPLTTWFHHFAYVALLKWVIKKNYCLLFGIFLVEELPTFILSMGRIDKALRSDLGFGGTYFLLRIALHTYMVGSCFMYDTKEPWWKALSWPFEYTNFGPMMFNLVLTTALHYNWFYSWVLQQRRLANQGAKVKKGD
eukprot:UN1654